MKRLTQLDRIERKLLAILGHLCQYRPCTSCQWALTPQEFEDIKPQYYGLFPKGDK